MISTESPSSLKYPFSLAMKMPASLTAFATPIFTSADSASEQRHDESASEAIKAAIDVARQALEYQGKGHVRHCAIRMGYPTPEWMAATLRAFLMLEHDHGLSALALSDLAAADRSAAPRLLPLAPPGFVSAAVRARP